MREEVSQNWNDAVQEVHESKVSKNSNVIRSHTHKIKSEKKGKRMKARICTHGNRYIMRKTVRKNSANAQFDVIRLLLSFASIHYFWLGCTDIKSVFTSKAGL